MWKFSTVKWRPFGNFTKFEQKSVFSNYFFWNKEMWQTYLFWYVKNALRDTTSLQKSVLYISNLHIMARWIDNFAFSGFFHFIGFNRAFIKNVIKKLPNFNANLENVVKNFSNYKTLGSKNCKLVVLQIKVHIFKKWTHWLCLKKPFFHVLFKWALIAQVIKCEVILLLMSVISRKDKSVVGNF